MNTDHTLEEVGLQFSEREKELDKSKQSLENWKRPVDLNSFMFSRKKLNLM